MSSRGAAATVTPIVRAFFSAACMNATSISFGLLIVLFTILLPYWMRRLKPQLAGLQSQRICPSCGLITSRLNPRCLECGVASFSKP